MKNSTMFYEVRHDEFIVTKRDKNFYPKKYVCGVYEIVSPDGKIYVGQSRDIFSRWNCYKSIKLNGQRLIHESLTKFGVNSHVFKIIKRFDTDCNQLDLDIFERNVILFHLSEGTTILNSTIGGVSKTKYCKDSLEWMSKRMEHEPCGSKKRKDLSIKNKLERVLKPKKVAYSNKNDVFYWNVTRVKSNLEVFGKPIVQLTLGDVFIKEWDSSATVERELKISPKTIRKSIKGIYMPKSKFKWVYKKDYENKSFNS